METGIQKIHQRVKIPAKRNINKKDCEELKTIFPGINDETGESYIGHVMRIKQNKIKV